MTYVDGFVLAVPKANQKAYRKMASDASAVFCKHGATRFVETWGKEVPQGKVNCLNSAVLRKPDEVVVFSWIVWPSKAARDAGNAQAMADPELCGSGMDCPFDGQRMLFGGFELLCGDALATPGVLDGVLMPVPSANRAAYKEVAEKMASLLREYGATAVVDCWGDDLPEGKVNSFHTAVLRKPDESVVFSWISWEDQAAQERGWAQIMADPRMEELSPKTVGADMSRMIYGTFTPLVVV